ncbi:hypothetical protein AR686_11765 [Chryseobacterium aquaticum subsp. greenlandense]|uniref:Uncharacterized protein n=1 Tax=Chryseobacterium aquaticum subsp. greenlandense TaxID=345663 RepID=A0A124F2P2_9FLAO|nr:hypothetical protein AR686_11765 [Chryseobacterium aquaticum subsp. greenlandense]
MKFKFSIAVFLVGFLITLLGAWLKIAHMSIGPLNGNISLTIGTIIQIVGVILLIIQIVISKKS